MEIAGDIKRSFREGSVITRLIYLNLALFLLFTLQELIFPARGGEGSWSLWFSLPADPVRFLAQPWSLVTFPFIHSDFLSLLFNLLMLYWFGMLFLDCYSQDQLLGLYLLGGVAGGAFYLAAGSLFPFAGGRAGGHAAGASLPVMAILTAAAVCNPERRILLFLIGRIRLKYLAMLMVAGYALLSPLAGAGTLVSRLGAAGAGWFWVVLANRGCDPTRFVGWLKKNTAFPFKSRRNVRVVHRQPPRDDYEYNRQRAAGQAELNRILDKIAEEGYDSLSREEKETLFRHGR